MRTDTSERPTGGLKRLSHLHALVPKLGLFVGEEAAVPYDYAEVFGAIAPRPTLLVTPMRDRDATLADINVTVQLSKRKTLVHLVPDDYSRLSMEVTDATVEWAMKTLLTLSS